jgi:hypothetical protein
MHIPGAEVKEVYVNGVAVDKKLYEAKTHLALVRWAGEARPKSAVHIHAGKALSTQELTLRWKQLAIVLPVAGASLAGTDAVELSIWLLTHPPVK